MARPHSSVSVGEETLSHAKGIHVFLCGSPSTEKPIAYFDQRQQVDSRNVNIETIHFQLKIGNS